MDELTEARKYEQENMKRVPLKERMEYHLTPAIGWMNDPNGFSEYRHEYHLFYQYYPYNIKWGSMHWGHAVTKDFIKWKYLPVAMAPDQPYETGCFSGSAVADDDGNHVLMYTSHRELPKEGIQEEQQSIAVGDGLNYIKYENNPVITKEKLPEGFEKEDFRDPKIWREPDGWYVVIASRRADGRGAVLLYQSQDGINWEFVSILFENNGNYGNMWECPDFFLLNDNAVLLVSPMEMRGDGLEFHNGNGVIYCLGDYDRQNHRLDASIIKSIDYGLDFYAPTTTEISDGRRIMVGWMQSWQTAVTANDDKTIGSITVPRELWIQDGRLYQMPVRELEQYREKEVIYQREIILAGNPMKYSGIQGRVIDLEIEILQSDFVEFKINLAENEKYKTTVAIKKNEGVIVFNRQQSGLTKDVLEFRKMPVDFMEGEISLRILLDKKAVEIFVNGGRQAMTNLIPTPLEAEGISFETDADTLVNIKKYDII